MDDSEQEQFNHISEYSKFKAMFFELRKGISNAKELQYIMRLQADLYKANNIDLKSFDDIFCCTYCDQVFISFGARYFHYYDCGILRRSEENVKK